MLVSADDTSIKVSTGSSVELVAHYETKPKTEPIFHIATGVNDPLCPATDAGAGSVVGYYVR